MINGSDMVVIAVISLIGTVIITQLLNHNWFKRQQLKEHFYGKRQDKNIDFEKFKINKRIHSKMLNVKKPDLGPVDWIDKLKGLNPEILHSLVDSVTGTPEETDLTEGLEEPAGIENTILSMVKDNPDLVTKFVKGMGNKDEKKENYL